MKNKNERKGEKIHTIHINEHKILLGKPNTGQNPARK